MIFKNTSKSKLTLAIISIVITFFVWQQGLRDSLNRPSVSFDISQKEQEIAELSVQSIPVNLKKFFIINDPVDQINKLLTDVSFEELTERNKLIRIITSESNDPIIFKNISINNLYLGFTQIGVHTSFNLVRKVILLTAPFTNGLSLLPYGPIAIIQAVIAVHSTKILGKLAAKEIFIRSKASFIEPANMIKNMTFNDTEIFNHINIYFSNKNLNNYLLPPTITGGLPPSEPGKPGTTCVLPSHLSRNNLKST